MAGCIPCIIWCWCTNRACNEHHDIGQALESMIKRLGLSADDPLLKGLTNYVTARGLDYCQTRDTLGRLRLEGERRFREAEWYKWPQKTLGRCQRVFYNQMFRAVPRINGCHPIQRARRSIHVNVAVVRFARFA